MQYLSHRFVAHGIWVLVVSVLLPSFRSNAQTQGLKLWIEFSDKQNTPYSFENPEKYLSIHAIERRKKFNIPLDSTDLPVVPAYVDSIRQTGVDVLYKSKWMNAVAVQMGQSGITAQDLKQFAFVEEIDTVATTKSGKLTQKRDKFLHQYQSISTNSTDYYGFALNQIDMLRGDLLHKRGFTGQGIRVAVMDAGFFQVDEIQIFNKLRKENRILDTYDFVEHEKNVYDEGFHGAAVLSTMAAEAEGTIVGTAPDAKYLLYRTENVNSEFIIEEHNWIAAAERADSAGAQVLNTSLGYTTFQDSTTDHTYADMDGNTTPISRAADLAARKGIIVVNSAGNAGTSPWHYIGAPADGDSVVAVGAVKPDRTFAAFSSRGPSSDGDVKPNIAAQGQEAVIYHPARDTVVLANGTSFASPIAAGMFACLKQAHPEKNPWQIVQEVQANASRANRPDSSVGYGIPDFYEAHLRLEEESDIVFEENKLPRVYPNPVQDEVHLMLHNKENQQYNMALYNLKGQKLWQRQRPANKQGFYKYSFPSFHQLSSGLYLLKLKGKETQQVFKIWKSNAF